MEFKPEYLLQRLALLPKAKRYIVGFSGGLDSLVLLTALSQLKLPIPILAIHVNHSIQEDSDDWQEACAEICERLGVEFVASKVDAMHPSGESPEAWARNKRYEVFKAHMQPEDVLLLAHHQDDQIETFFLQLLRGSGPNGLSAMSMTSAFSLGWIVRPLLEVKREKLEAYAQKEQLDWIEDPSNLDSRYDRNYLRNEVLPLLKKRWPSYQSSIERSISLQSEACVLLSDLAQAAAEDLSTQNNNQLSVRKLLLYNDVEIRNILYHWIKAQGFLIPSAKKFREIIAHVLSAAADRSPCVEWSGAEVRRHHDELIIMKPLAQHDSSQIFQWDLSEPLELSSGIISSSKQLGEGFKVEANLVEVRFRQGGESFRPFRKNKTITLKKFLQEQGMPTWLRDRVPLVYVNDQLAAVSDLCVTEQFAASENEVGFSLNWQSN